MHFTQEDYKKIEDWLNKRSIKDTEFQEASPLKGDEIIAITQKGYNRKINVKDLVDQLLNLGIEDFINVTSSYDSPNISLEEAIHLIPDKARKEGQVITFLNKEGKWEIHQFTGKLNQWNNITLWNNYHMIEAITTTSSMSDGTLASVGKVPLFSYKGKWYDALGFKGQNKSGLHGERPTSLDTTDGGYIFYDASYKKWCYWDGESWKSIGNDYDVMKSTKGSSSNRPTNVSSGFMYYDETINKPIWWTGDKWVNATGDDV